jgi:hypothetical protein
MSRKLKIKETKLILHPIKINCLKHVKRPANGFD